VGLKGGWRGNCTPALPPIEEWREFVARDGRDGGQSAYCLWSGPATTIWNVLNLGVELLDPPCYTIAYSVASLRFPPRRACTNRPLAEELGTKDCDRLCHELARHHHGHAVPPWSVPRGIWRSLLTNTAEMCSLQLRTYLQQLCVLIRECDAAPVQWSTSWTCPAAKHNCKTGCLGFRLLQIFGFPQYIVDCDIVECAIP